MMTELLVELVKRATLEHAVAVASIEQGITLMVYPLAGEMLIGVGLEGHYAQRIDSLEILRRRASDARRFGPWLPALFQDGSWYVARRVRVLDPETPVLDQEALDAAEELLA